MPYRRSRHANLHFKERWACEVLGWRWTSKLCKHIHLNTYTCTASVQQQGFTNCRNDMKFLMVDRVKSWKHQFTQADRCPWLAAFCAITGFVWPLATVRKSKELACTEGWDNNGGFKLVSVFAFHRRYISQQPFGWLAPFLFLYVLQHLGTRRVWYRDQAKIFHIP